MDVKIVRTEEEIDEQIRRGEGFVKRHPYSVFGDDNRRNLRIIKDVLDQEKKGIPLAIIEDSVEDLNDEDYSQASYVIEWLMYKNSVELYYDGE